MDFILDNFELVLTVVGYVVSAAVTVLTPYAFKAFKKVFEKIEKKANIDIDDQLEQQIFNVAVGAVSSLYHTTVRELKQKSKNGKLTKAQAKESFQAAVKLTVNQLPADVKAEFGEESITAIVAKAFNAIKFNAKN